MRFQRNYVGEIEPRLGTANLDNNNVCLERSKSILVDGVEVILWGGKTTLLLDEEEEGGKTCENMKKCFFLTFSLQPSVSSKFSFNRKQWTLWYTLCMSNIVTFTDFCADIISCIFVPKKKIVSWIYFNNKLIMWAQI